MVCALVDVHWLYGYSDPEDSIRFGSLEILYSSRVKYKVFLIVEQVIQIVFLRVAWSPTDEVLGVWHMFPSRDTLALYE